MYCLFYWITSVISKPSCLKNWIYSLRGFIYLTPKLFAANFTKIAPRCFNQDPIENFFSCIRSYGFRNTNPTCSSFITSCKFLSINNFVTPHSTGANYESALNVAPPFKTDNAFICEKDFSNNFFTDTRKTRLHKYALPSIFLREDNETSINNVRPVEQIENSTITENLDAENLIPPVMPKAQNRHPTKSSSVLQVFECKKVSSLTSKGRKNPFT
jgi:hypothetical protein